MELLVAVGVGMVIMLTGIGLVGVYLRISSQDLSFQGANFLSQDLMDGVTAAAEGDWESIANATTSHHLATSTMGFAVKPCKESKTINNTAYTRYFSVAPVCRDTGENIGPCGVDDPATKKIKVTVEWLYRGAPASIFLDKYLTKTSNRVFHQTDWMGGAACAGVVDPVAAGYNTRFCSAVDIDITSLPGSIKIQGY